MATLLARVRYVIGAFALLLVVAVAVPAGAQQPTSVNPTASSVKEQQLLQEFNRVQGRITIPDAKEGVLIQPAGESWRQFHQVTLRWIGAIAIIGVLALLIVFFMVRGMIRISSGRSGRTILRFNTLERSVHWLTAVSFVILALSGLNITFGKPLLLPLLAPETFTLISQWAKYAHNYLSFPFAIGVAFIFFLWIKDNIPDEVDVEWLKQGGGMVGSKRPPARRFNAGQKIVYWLVVLVGGAIVISGYLLMFPFYGTGISGMQLAQIVHGVGGVLMIAAMLAHIYIGTIGMEGAFEAMGTGEVDLNWAKEHHKLWVEEEMRGSPAGARPRMTPAE
jgi:formate dehydrogenase subunit gamma